MPLCLDLVHTADAYHCGRQGCIQDRRLLSLFVAHLSYFGVPSVSGHECAVAVTREGGNAAEREKGGGEEGAFLHLLRRSAQILCSSQTSSPQKPQAAAVEGSDIVYQITKVYTKLNTLSLIPWCAIVSRASLEHVKRSSSQGRGGTNSSFDLCSFTRGSCHDPQGRSQL